MMKNRFQEKNEKKYFQKSEQDLNSVFFLVEVMEVTGFCYFHFSGVFVPLFCL